MILTQMTIRAAQIAEEAHRGQRDKSGMPYIFHPLHVAEQMPDEYKTAAALLHDVAEDTTVTLEQLAAEFPPRVIAALALLTHDPAEDYFSYVRRVRENPDAAAVKRADLLHNLDESRPTAEPPAQTAQRREKYRLALRILDGAEI